MIEKILLHENFEIQGNAEDGFYAKFVDAELDPFIVRFHFDNCATIETEWSAYMKISSKDLGLLSYLVEKTDKMYKDYYKSLKK
tara:strand:- start:410 stop:661 length:252 start_codon:yes stop_codon:yes gene_type:complete